MKEIKAFIKPGRVQQVVTALKEQGFDCITISMAEGTGSLKRPDAFPSLEFKFTDSKVVKLELVCQTEHADKIVQIISEHGRSPERGDGKEAGWISITGLPVSVNVDWLGVFPTLETFVSQIVLLVAMLVMYYFSNRKSNLLIN